MLPGVGGFRVTRVTDKELLTQNQHYAMMHSISAMQENQHKSVEEIRYEAYAKAGEPAPPGTSPGAFGQPTSGGTPFGTSAAGSGFGGGPNPSAGVFGAPASTLTLGGTAGASFVPAASSPFGVANNTAFGGTPGAASPLERPLRQPQEPSERRLKVVGHLVQSQLVRASSVAAHLRVVPLVTQMALQALVVQQRQHLGEALEELVICPLVVLLLLRGRSAGQRLPTHSVHLPHQLLLVVVYQPPVLVLLLR